MTWHLRLLLFGAIWLTATTLLTGCGVPKYKISGKLTKNGQAMSVAKDTLVTIRFTAEPEDANQSFGAKFNQETGGYEVEVPPGKYHVTYVIVEKGQAPLTSSPSFKQKTYDLAKSQELDIDITAK